MKIGNVLLTPTLISAPLFFNKCLEIELTSGDDWQIFNFRFEITRKTDHAGLTFQLSVFKLFWFAFRIYDHRHWNTENNRWEIYSDDIDE